MSVLEFGCLTCVYKIVWNFLFFFCLFHFPCLVFSFLFPLVLFSTLKLRSDQAALSLTGISRKQWLHYRGLSVLPWGHCSVLETPLCIMRLTPCPQLHSTPALEHVRNKGNKADIQRKWRNCRREPNQTGKHPRKVGGIWRWWKRKTLKESPGVVQSAENWSIGWVMHFWANYVNRNVLLEERPEDQFGFLLLK